VVSIDAMNSRIVLASEGLEVDRYPIGLVTRGGPSLLIGNDRVSSATTPEAQYYFWEEAIAAAVQEPPDVLYVVLIQLPLVSGSRAVFHPLVGHCGGDFREVAQVGESANDFEGAEDVFLEEALE
jgi:hypothetical protein